MSNEHHHTSNLVSELVEMATATKRLPEVEAQLREAYRRQDELISRNQELERKIEQEVAINTELASKLHAAEVARDDAGFRQLEAEDKATGLQRVISDALSSFGLSIAAVSSDGKDQVVRMSTAEVTELEYYRVEKAEAERKAAEEAAKPVDPTPVATVEEPLTVTATVTSSEGQREPDPTGESLAPTPSPSAEPSVSPSPVSYGGVSVPSDPTVAVYGAYQQISQSETARDTSAQSQAGAPIRKYANRRYADWPYYVSEAGWIEGGGTHESYWEGRASWSSPKTA